MQIHFSLHEGTLVEISRNSCSLTGFSFIVIHQAKLWRCKEIMRTLDINILAEAWSRRMIKWTEDAKIRHRGTVIKESHQGQRNYSRALMGEQWPTVASDRIQGSCLLPQEIPACSRQQMDRDVRPDCCGAHRHRETLVNSQHKPVHRLFVVIECHLSD